MLRNLTRIVLGLGAILLIAGFAVYGRLSSSLPQIDGVIEVVGPDSDVTVERDEQGLVTIRAANRRDAAYATGFVHGQDRFFQMDLTRRKAAGELAELIGRELLPLDRANRLHRFRARAADVVARLTEDERQILTAYVKGVNDGLGSLGNRPFEYDLLEDTPVAWRTEDSMLVAYAMFMVLNDDRAMSDIRRGLAHAVLPPTVYAWLYPQGTEWDAPLMGAARHMPPMPSADVFDLSARNVEIAAVPYPDAPVAGSNNWAVAGSLTASGRAIVANDMHLDIAVPNVFYRLRIIVPGDRDVAGLSLPGVPIVVAGSNTRVAWGFTNSYGDWSDAVVVTPAGEGSYATADGPKPYEIHEETIRVKDGQPETITVRDTVWGPVLEAGTNPRAETAVAWIAHDPDALNLGHLQLETVANVDEALAVANRLGMPPQNFVCGDATGNIGWTLTGRIPRRAGYDPLLPADWSDGSGWQGWLEPQQYPRIVNPASGRLWTANSRVADGDALEAIGDGGYDFGARQKQIRDLLMARERFEPIDMLDIQNDDRAVFLARWRDLLLGVLDDAAVGADPARRDYRQQIVEWIPRASVESVGYRLVRGFRLEVRATVFEMLMAPVRDVYGADQVLRMSNQFEGALWQLVTQRPRHLLSANYDSWQQLMLAAVDRQIAALGDGHKDGLDGRTWGEFNTAAIRHPLSRAIPQLSSWLDMPADPLSGDVNMPKALGPSFGASERFAVSPGDESDGYLHMPAGQSGHPMSDYYRAGHEDWVNVVPTPFLPGPPRHSLQLKAL